MDARRRSQCGAVYHLQAGHVCICASVCNPGGMLLGWRREKSRSPVCAECAARIGAVERGGQPGSSSQRTRAIEYEHGAFSLNAERVTERRIQACKFHLCTVHSLYFRLSAPGRLFPCLDVQALSAPAAEFPPTLDLEQPEGCAPKETAAAAAVTANQEAARTSRSDDMNAIP